MLFPMVGVCAILITARSFVLVVGSPIVLML